MYKIGFVILHFNTIDDTIQCVNSIQDKMDTDNYEIIIVDNNSNNHSAIELQEKYKNDTKLHMILNSQNLGFAKGNNIGFEYAKNELNCDFIVLLNNDTYLIQDNFYKILIKEYETSNYGVMGPKIILKENKVNPINFKLKSSQELKIEIFKKRIKLWCHYLFLEKFLEKLKIFLKLEKKVIIKENLDPNQRYYNIILHGCCLIFSPNYIKKFNGIDERTFLFHEEELLYIRLKEHDLISVYNPQLLIFHNEDSATNSITKTKRKKEIFLLKNDIQSSKILYKELVKQKNKERQNGRNLS